MGKNKDGEPNLIGAPFTGILNQSPLLNWGNQCLGKELLEKRKVEW